MVEGEGGGEGAGGIILQVVTIKIILVLFCPDKISTFGEVHCQIMSPMRNRILRTTKDDVTWFLFVS